jgi:hypothetical protein
MQRPRTGPHMARGWSRWLRGAECGRPGPAWSRCSRSGCARHRSHANPRHRPGHGAACTSCTARGPDRTWSSCRLAPRAERVARRSRAVFGSGQNALAGSAHGRSSPASRNGRGRRPAPPSTPKCVATLNAGKWRHRSRCSEGGWHFGRECRWSRGVCLRSRRCGCASLSMVRRRARGSRERFHPVASSTAPRPFRARFYWLAGIRGNIAGTPAEGRVARGCVTCPFRFSRSRSANDRVERLLLFLLRPRGVVCHVACVAPHVRDGGHAFSATEHRRCECDFAWAVPCHPVQLVASCAPYGPASYSPWRSPPGSSRPPLAPANCRTRAGWRAPRSCPRVLTATRVRALPLIPAARSPQCPRRPTRT